MAQPFSEETRELLERADRAIDRSIQLREHSKQPFANSRHRQSQMKSAFNRQRAEIPAPKKQPLHPRPK
jgi:hypothetical protein